MDLGVDEELNYEEEEPENESFNNDSPSKECEDDRNDDLTLSGSHDQYLQIDYSEDENLAFEETVTEPANIEAGTVEKETEKIENPNKEDVSLEQKESSPSKKKGRNVGSNKSKRKKRYRPFHSRVQLKKNLTNFPNCNPWLPEHNFLENHNHVTQRKPVTYENQRLNNINQDFYHVQNPAIPQLMGISTRFQQSRNPNKTGINTRNFSQQTPSQNGQNYKMDNGKMLFSRTFGVFSNDIRNPSILDQNQNYKGLINKTGFANNCKINDGTKYGFIYETFCNPKVSGISSAFSNQGMENYGTENQERFINVQYKSLEVEEKKSLMLKKEARLKRFMQDDVKNDKLTDSGFEFSKRDCSTPKVQCFWKIEEKIHLEGQQKENSHSDSDQDTLLAKTGINKELLLKKINPFETNLGMSNYNLMTRVKQSNERIEGLKEESVDSKLWNSITPLTKTEVKAPTSPPRCFAPVKTEAESPVKFVRTISKSFDELTSRKLKTTPEKSFPVLRDVKSFSFMSNNCTEKNITKQLEPQLTGCIVKVLNIPPSTTTNDILALCSSIGIVMEVKLNFPKENSVVIRFAEPTCAENFFSLYHGQKMNNYFLNVIVI